MAKVAVATKPWWSSASVLKDWWWLIALVTGAIVVWGNLPRRVDKVEATQVKQQEDLVDLKSIANKLDGYIQGQQTTNRLLQQQAPNQAAVMRDPSVHEWQDPDTGEWWCIAVDADPEQDSNWWRCP